MTPLSTPAREPPISPSARLGARTSVCRVQELLRQRRWAGFTAFVLILVVATGFLASWQWSRYRQRQAENARLDAALAAPAVPVDVLLTAGPPGAGPPLDPALRWRTVTATGRFDATSTAAVRRRPQQGQLGFWIVTALHTDRGVLLVNRGWVAAHGPDATATPDVPAPPAGQVTVTGRLRSAEVTTQTDAPPPGQAWAADPDQLVPPETARYPAYIDLTSSDPADTAGLASLPRPEHKGANNFSYTFQWIFFGLIGLFGWWRLLRSQTESARSAP